MGQVDNLFLQQGYLALGWFEMGDLSAVPADREAFKARMHAILPAKSKMQVAVDAGQLFRFMHEMKQGDLAVYPSKVDQHIHIGQISGDYVYRPDVNREYPNQRSVNWLKSVPRTQFSQGALYELGTMSVALISTYTDEFIAALEGKSAPTPVLKDETAPQVVEDIEQSTRDFILKRLAQQLKGHPFADLVAHLLTTMGYRTRSSSPGPDMGVDIVANRGELGFEPPIIKVQVKSGEGSVGGPTVNELLGTVGQGEYGLLVTLGTFTPQARTIARNRNNLRLVDGQEFVELILSHYEQLDPRYKGLLPLKRVYVPDLAEPEDEA
jgi:restriction system protein